MIAPEKNIIQNHPHNNHHGQKLMSKNKIHPNILIQFTTLVIYLVFVCSVVYNFAYFMAAGISLSQIPLTLSDIVNSIFVWTPFVTLVAAAGWLFILITKRMEQGMTEKEIAQSTSNPEKTEQRRDLPFIIVEWTSVVAVSLFILFGQQLYRSLSAVFTMFMVFWFFIGRKLSDHPRIMERRSLWLKLIIVFAPIIIGFVFTRGYDDAIHAISQTAPNSIIYLADKEKISGVTLRNFEKGILIRKLDSNKLTFLPWLDILSIDTQFEQTYYRGLICIWTKWCPTAYITNAAQPTGQRSAGI
jgi:hypothetical protein